MRRPSPSIVVSTIAVVLAAGGTSIAAIDYARNAGAVDGKSATGAASSQARAAGKLVATANAGSLKGRLPARFLDLSGVVAGSKGTFAQGVEVADNQTTAPFGIGGYQGVGLVTATCTDQNNTAGKEDPSVTVTFANTSGTTVNFSRTIGTGNPAVTAVAAGTQATFTIANSNTFQLYAQTGSTHYVLNGNVRQDGQGSASAACVLWGYGLAL